MNYPNSIVELERIAAELRALLLEADRNATLKSLDRLERAAVQIGKSHSGSWLGNQSLIYYSDFAQPPSSAVFSPEWGLVHYESGLRYASNGTKGDWKHFSKDEIDQKILEVAGNSNLGEAQRLSQILLKEFEQAKRDMISILEIESLESQFLSGFRGDLTSLAQDSPSDLGRKWVPEIRTISRDSTAISQGIWMPPHIEILMTIADVRQPIQLCKQAAMIAENIAKHLQRSSQSTIKQGRTQLKESEADNKNSTNQQNTYNITAGDGIVLNLGGEIKDIFLTLDKSIKTISTHEQQLASKLKEFAEAVQLDKQLPEGAKLVVLERANEIAEQAAKAPAERKKLSILDNIKGIKDTLTGIGALEQIWEQVEPLIHHLPK